MSPKIVNSGCGNVWYLLSGTVIVMLMLYSISGRRESVYRMPKPAPDSERYLRGADQESDEETENNYKNISESSKENETENTIKIIISNHSDNAFSTTNIISETNLISSNSSTNNESSEMVTVSKELTTANPIATVMSEEEWMMQKGVQMKERQLRVQRVCKEKEESTGKSVHWHLSPYTMLIDDEHKLAYCRQAKVGTSTLLRHFLSLASGMSEKRKAVIRESGPRLHASVPQYYQLKVGAIYRTDKLLEYIQDYVSFSFVRHPFERLVSAFANKILEQDYRDLNQTTGGDFIKFVDHVLEEFRRSNCKTDRECHGSDIHWRPLYARCAYCDVPYLIAKMDTFQDDLWYLANLAGVTNLLNVTRSGQDQVRMNASKVDLSVAQRTKEYFDMLDQERKLKLWQMYEFDFQLFDYSPEPYSTGQ